MDPVIPIGGALALPGCRVLLSSFSSSLVVGF
jgi:hypothetical protein